MIILRHGGNNNLLDGGVVGHIGLIALDLSHVERVGDLVIVGIHDVIGRDIKSRLAKREGAVGGILSTGDDIVVLRKRELEVALGKIGTLEHLGARDLCMGGGYAVRKP